MSANESLSGTVPVLEESMTTETTDPLEAVMAAAADYAADVLFVGVVVDKRTDASRATHRHTRERLRLHVQLALAKARLDGPENHDVVRVAELEAEIAALEARLQEQE